MSDNNRYQNPQAQAQEILDDDHMPQLNVNNIQSEFNNGETFNMNFYNSHSSALNREIPPESMKIVNDLFDDSERGTIKESDRSLNFNIDETNRHQDNRKESADNLRFTLFEDSPKRMQLVKEYENLNELQVLNLNSDPMYNNQSFVDTSRLAGGEDEAAAHKIHIQEEIVNKEEPLNTYIIDNNNNYVEKNINQFDIWDSNWEFNNNIPKNIIIKNNANTGSPGKPSNRQDFYKEDNNKIEIDGDKIIKMPSISAKINNADTERKISNSFTIKNINNEIISNNFQNKPAYENLNFNNIYKTVTFENKNANNIDQPPPSKSPSTNIMEKNIGIDYDKIMSKVNLKEDQDQDQGKGKGKEKEKGKNLKDDYLNDYIIDDSVYDKNYNNEFNNFKNLSEFNSQSNNDEYINLQKFTTNNVPNNLVSRDTRSTFTNENFERQFNQVLALESDKAYGKSRFYKDSSDILKEKKIQIIKDDSFFQLKNCGNVIIEKGSNLTATMNLEEEHLKIQIQILFEDMIMTSGDLDDIKIKLNKYTLDEKINLSPISYLNELEKGDIQNGNQNYYKEMKRSIKAKRVILTDGNSFYRAFMFAVIENYILKGDILTLKKILFDFDEKINNTFKQNDISINKNTFNAVFYFIIDNLENNNIPLAYEYFLKAYHRYPNFDFALIKYMRIALASYLITNQSSINRDDTFEQLNNLLPSGYMTKNGYNFKSFIEESILSMHSEADKIIIYLAPVVFNINLDLHVIEGTASGQNVKYFKMTYNCLQGDQKMNILSSTVSLMYKFCGYSTVYTNQSISEYADNIPFSQYNTNKIIDETNNQRMSTIAEIPCEVCNRQSVFIMFTHAPGLPLCKLCLLDFIKKIIIKRTKNYTNEFCNNTEYYCRPIVIDTQKNCMLFDEDMHSLMGKSIPQLFLMYLERVCLFCHDCLVEGKFFTMLCECKICKNCIDKKIDAGTEGKVVQNNFEKTYSTGKKQNCACGMPFDLDNAVTVSKGNLERFIIQAHDRLIKQAQSYCAICRLDMRKEKGVEKGINATNTFPIVEERESNPNVANSTHVLCRHCILSFKGDLMKMSGSGRITSNTKTIPLKCTVCIKKTHQVELKYFKQMMKSEGACCSIL